MVLRGGRAKLMCPAAPVKLRVKLRLRLWGERGASTTGGQGLARKHCGELEVVLWARQHARRYAEQLARECLCRCCISGSACHQP